MLSALSVEEEEDGVFLFLTGLVEREYVAFEPFSFRQISVSRIREGTSSGLRFLIEPVVRKVSWMWEYESGRASRIRKCIASRAR